MAMLRRSLLVPLVKTLGFGTTPLISPQNYIAIFAREGFGKL
jgi:hypothetical protein